MFCRNYFHQDLYKGQKWPNYFISGKLFQKRPNGNPVQAYVLSARTETAATIWTEPLKYLTNIVKSGYCNQSQISMASFT
jgi:hypothetical protein